jgi:hypothetical protein
MSRCAECGTRSTKRSYHRVQRLAGGNYRTAARIIWTSVCDVCICAASAYHDLVVTDKRNPGKWWGPQRLHLAQLVRIHDRELT